MARKTLWLIVIGSMLMAALVLASCTAATESTPAQTVQGTTTQQAATTTTTTTTTPAGTTTTPATPAESGPEMIRNAWGELQEKPQYGGTITRRASSDPARGFDPWFYGGSGVYEELFTGNWIAPRDQGCDFLGVFWPEECGTGALAESWEQPDPETTIINVRQGVRFHNKPPVNGRQLVADDIVYSWGRQFGIGAGFTEPSPHFGPENYGMITSVEAIDKYTVVFKHSPSLELMHNFLTQGVADAIYPHEVVDMYGDLTDWKYAIGTGAWMLDDFVSGSSLTYVKNPDYWGTDEMFPDQQFQLPYADRLQYLIIPDVQTAMAALRTGKIAESSGISWEQQLNLADSNPELQFASSAMGGWTLGLKYGVEPFDDIRVRKALQMAIDLEEIAETHYGGTASATPKPLLDLFGYYTPLNEAPADVQAGYAYDPEGAKALLAEAGYPSGFKTTILLSTGASYPGAYDVDLIQIVKAYWKVIGVDAEIDVKEAVTFTAILFEGRLEQIGMWPGQLSAQPVGVLGWWTSTGSPPWNIARIDNEKYNNLIIDASATMDREEWLRLLKEANDYAFAQQWAVTLLKPNSFIAWQPWLKGYRGERGMGATSGEQVWARVWIDQDLKFDQTGQR